MSYYYVAVAMFMTSFTAVTMGVCAFPAVVDVIE